jgi:hypothetical protein
VYAASSLTEQTTPETHLIFDAVALVSAIVFTDKDLDPAELGGMVSWTAPAIAARVQSYTMYLATSAGGSYRSQIGGGTLAPSIESFMLPETQQVFSAETLQVFSATTQQVFDTNTTNLTGTSATTGDLNDTIITTTGEYTQLVVYTKSWLVEQTTPDALTLVDNIAMASNATFFDWDLDEGDIFGNLAWIAAEDTSQVTEYLLYLSPHTDGAGVRASLGDTPVGTDNFTLLEDTSLSLSFPPAFTQFLVCTASFLVEQTTPLVFAIVDATATVSGVSLSSPFGRTRLTAMYCARRTEIRERAIMDTSDDIGHLPGFILLVDVRP